MFLYPSGDTDTARYQGLTTQLTTWPSLKSIDGEVIWCATIETYVIPLHLIHISCIFLFFAIAVYFADVSRCFLRVIAQCCWSIAQACLWRDWQSSPSSSNRSSICSLTALGQHLQQRQHATQIGGICITSEFCHRVFPLLSPLRDRE